MAMASLYRRVLGEQFHLLPRQLQQFHDQPQGARGRGEFQIRRGTGRIRNWVASLAGFPPAAAKVPVSLEVVVEGNRERWIRNFGTLRMETVQWDRGGLLIEAAGPIRFGIKLEADSTSLRYKLCSAWLYSLPLPVLLWLKGSASERLQDDGSLYVNVCVTGPFGGTFLSYEGIFHAELTSQ